MRSCDGCTACCTGALEVKVFDQLVGKNNPCSYMCDTGCSINDDPKRPKACAQYQCFWTLNSDVPDWMKPSLSGVILDEENGTFRASCTKEVSGYVFLYLLHLAKEFDTSLTIWHINNPHIERNLGAIIAMKELKVFGERP
jgi:hypothetical protein